MSVLVFGSLNLDLVAYAKQLPTLGQTVTGEKLLRFPGGKGLNQAIAAKRSGSQVLMVGALGSDSEGDFLSQVLVEEKVDPRFISKVEVQTGIAVIEVSSDAQNRILIIPGANATVKFNESYLSNSALSKVCLAQLETPIVEVSKFMIKAKNAGSITILNPAPIQDLSSELISACDYLVVNESEASYLTGKSVEKLSLNEARDIGIKLISKGANAVVITLAENGSLYLDKQDEIYTPAFKVNAVDTTGAGDCFIGSFSYALGCGLDPSSAAQFACRIASISVTRKGAQSSYPRAAEISTLS